MPALKVTRTTLFNDADGDGAPAFGELLAHTIVIKKGISSPAGRRTIT
jgi:hypothetical protein